MLVCNPSAWLSLSIGFFHEWQLDCSRNSDLCLPPYVSLLPKCAARASFLSVSWPTSRPRAWIFERVDLPLDSGTAPSAFSSPCLASPRDLRVDLGSNPAPAQAELGVRPEPHAEPLPQTPSRVLSAAAPSSGQPPALPALPPAQRISEADRRLIARDVGRFFRRALDGEHRGQSGRARNPLSSTVYVVCRGASGPEYRPPLLLKSFADTKVLCQIQGQLRDSIFCGLPSRWEAVLACEEAGLGVPIDSNGD